MGSTSQEAEDANLTKQSDICFIPPLYEQRYQEIVRISRECQPKKVVDIGCGELKVIRLLKFHQYIHELIGVDIDEDLLKRHSYTINPLASAYLSPLPHPLVITLLHGSIAERDSRLLNCDLAVCVEVIEHLYPHNVRKATEVIFGYMKPTRAVFTTPNAEFNVLFPGLHGFRHDDHKFEWTRREFQEWGDQACSEYGYSVEYSGLGTGPEGSEHLGFCTQMAIFDRISPATDSPVESTDEDQEQMPYTEVARAVYPSKLLSDEDIVAEAEVRVRQLLKDAGRLMDDEEGMFDNAIEEDDDALFETWMNQSLASRTREKEGRDDQSWARSGGGEGGESELSTDKMCFSADSNTAAEKGSSHCITSAIEHSKETLPSPDVCCSRKLLNYANFRCRTKGDNLHSSSSSCQTTQETDLPNILDGVSSLNLRGTDLTVQLKNSISPEGSPTIHHSNDCISKLKVQSVERTDADMVCRNVLDFEECAHALGYRLQNFSSKDVEDGTSFYEQWEKGFPQRKLSYDLEELKISISLERLMRFPTLSEMCPDISKLREVLLASGKFHFCSDGAAIIAKLYEDSSDSELWEAASDEDWDSDAQFQGDLPEGFSVDVAAAGGIEEEECWD